MWCTVSNVVVSWLIRIWYVMCVVCCHWFNHHTTLTVICVTVMCAFRDCGWKCEDDAGNDLDDHPEVCHPGYHSGRWAAEAHTY